MIVLLYRAEPDLEFEGLLKRQHTRVKYFQGSLMNAIDLERAKVMQMNEHKILHKSRHFYYFSPQNIIYLNVFNIFPAPVHPELSLHFVCYLSILCLLCI